MENHNILASATTSALCHMIYQFMFRMSSFILNTLIIRQTSKELLGVVNVRLTLLYTTLLFVTQECFKKACTNRNSVKNKPWSEINNVLWLGVPASIFCVLILSLLWIFGFKQPVEPYYTFAVLAFGVSVVIESFSLPLFVLGQLHLYVKLRVQGERYVMTIFHVLNFQDQGKYDVINNLGSMVARFIFMPVEESSHLLFSQTLTRGKDASSQPKKDLELASSFLENVLKFVTTLGLLACAFGQAYSFLALNLYGGELLSSDSGPCLLRTFCVYLLLLAVNGVTESFVFSVMKKNQIESYNRKMLLFSIIFVILSLILTKLLGGVGFVWANGANMLARIIHSFLYIREFYKSSNYSPLKGVYPTKAFVISLLCSLGITCASERLFYPVSTLTVLIHVSIGGVCLAGVLLTLWLTDKAFIQFMLNFVRNRSNPKKIN
ncbi:DgyrCDS2367 [Dimorphilus gyrociliatus]|uniref:Protein RFT1 homolog n=1 Tax=Dimorphilus gyrociliatus TaxID=2664684 RepID=A0A7I8VA30_9ANNE|nr:DgyrCDS2367 [Dimorphilus gyrociliatus]